uniref:Uncharacterized protein n=1 Tax=Synechococcus elongatus (strain ATCC 33912 / PCC 7942 / FACHB-805) TaxID=1140 RepID=Q54758_SYNE7|nr:unknown [Synechococcus elongatus PCC 7942 = FACHB-805]
MIPAGVAPMAAKSERFAAAARQPIAAGGVVASLKWMPSTKTSLLTTNCCPAGGVRMAASSPRCSAGQNACRSGSKPCSPSSERLRSLTRRQVLAGLNQVLGTGDYGCLEDFVFGTQFFQHILAVNQITKGGIATIDQVEASWRQLRLKQEEEELRGTTVKVVAGTSPTQSAKSGEWQDRVIGIAAEFLQGGTVDRLAIALHEDFQWNLALLLGLRIDEARLRANGITNLQHVKIFSTGERQAVVEAPLH